MNAAATQPTDAELRAQVLAAFRANGGRPSWPMAEAPPDRQNMTSGNRAAPLTSDRLDLERWGAEFWNEPADAVVDMIRHRLLIKGRTHLVRGHYGQGKTIVLVDVARQWIEDGGHVIWLDYEMGKRPLRNRMQANGWSVAELARWHYAYGPTFERGELRRHVEALSADDVLVVIDSLAGAGMMFDEDENAASEAGRWFVQNVQEVREAGATVAAVEQEKQSATRSERYGRGTGAKSYHADVSWFVEAVEPFSRSRSGRLRLTLKKDREGIWSLGDELHFAIGDGEGGLPLVPISDDELARPAGDTPRDRRASIVAYLAEHSNGRERALPGAGVVAGIGGRRASVLDELRNLAGDPRAPVHVDPRGGRNGTPVYWHAEADDEASGLGF
jgi:hypothetical protein